MARKASRGTRAARGGRVKMARGVTLTKDQEYALESTIARIRRADFMSDEPGKYEFKPLEVHLYEIEALPSAR